MLMKFRQNASEFLLATVDIAGMLFSISGAAVVAFVGKLVFAVVLLAVALGFFLRLSGRRKVHMPPRAPGWVRPVAGVLSLVQVAVLTEAADLPVRFNQAGFEMWHWGLVVAALLAAYMLNMWLLASLGRRRRGATLEP